MPQSIDCSASIIASPVAAVTCAWRNNAAVTATLLALCASSSGLMACALPKACSRQRASACASRLCHGLPALLRNGAEAKRQRPRRSA